MPLNWSSFLGQGMQSYADTRQTQQAGQAKSLAEQEKFMRNYSADLMKQTFGSGLTSQRQEKQWDREQKEKNTRDFLKNFQTQFMGDKFISPNQQSLVASNLKKYNELATQRGGMPYKLERADALMGLGPAKYKLVPTTTTQAPQMPPQAPPQPQQQPMAQSMPQPTPTAPQQGMGARIGQLGGAVGRGFNTFRGQEPQGQKSPYPEYPNAYFENGVWKVKQDGKTYRIE